MTRKEAIKWLDTDTYIEMCAKAESEGKLIVECLEEANQLAIEALRQQAERDWIPFGGEATNNLLHRIAEYFKEWDGTEPAPTMQMNIDELRSIVHMHMDSCILRGELKEERKNAGWIPCSDPPKESGYYMACIYDSEVDNYDFRKTWFAHVDDYNMEESEWRELYDYETVTAWMPLPEPYKGE